MQNEIYEVLLEMMGKEEPAALVTVVQTKGSSPGKPGFKMLVDLQGNTVGTIGGGLVEATVINEAREAIRLNTPKYSTYNLNNDTAAGLGMICGGETTVFIDVIVSPETFLIIGAGHIAQPLALMAKILNFRVIVIDDREDFCNRERFPTADECQVGDIVKLLEEANINENTYLVIVTRGHSYDEKALEKTLNSKARYLGMIGSQKKVQTVFQNLLNKGFSEEKLKEVYAPIGLDIGAETPEEISVSILSQIIEVRNKGKA
jgi:xanthine dehydrogenase accessory factor